jgi:hypothetical protein
MKRPILLALLLGWGAAASGADDPAARLRGARSLHCAFTSTVLTWVRSGHRSIEQTNNKGTATYDNINVAKGTARIIASDGAGDIAIWRDSQENLWMLERSPSGNEIVTTVFPMYAESTDAFVVLETRHWLALSRNILAGETAYGTCRILE